jgi:hypothetical protein
MKINLNLSGKRAAPITTDGNNAVEEGEPKAKDREISQKRTAGTRDYPPGKNEGAKGG